MFKKVPGLLFCLLICGQQGFGLVGLARTPAKAPVRTSLSPAGTRLAESEDDKAALSGSFEELQQNGEKALSQNNYGQAEKYYLAALKSLEAAKSVSSDLRYATVYKSLSSFYEIRNQPAKSELFQEKELRARERCLGSEHPQVLSSVARLCRLYLQHGNQTKADRLSALLLNYASKVQKEETQIDLHFSELDKYFAKHASYKDPYAKLKLARESSDKARADEHLELAASLDSIATVYKERKKYPFAEQVYKKSLELREKTLAPGHLAIAFANENLGNLYAEQGKTQLAKPYFEASLEITRKTLDFKRPEVYQRLDGLAHSYISLGQLKEAETLYKQALTLIKDSCGTGNKDYVSASLSLASLYTKQGRASEAEPLLKAALRVSEGLNGPQSASLVPLLDKYAETLGSCGKTGDAAKMKQRADRIRGSSSACLDQSTDKSDF